MLEEEKLLARGETLTLTIFRSVRRLTVPSALTLPRTRFSIIPQQLWSVADAFPDKRGEAASPAPSRGR